MAVLKRYPDFEKIHLNDEMVISLPGLEIYPDQRKIYRDRQEIHLTAKEYDLLCLLVYNQGRVLTYEQIYQKVWGEEPFGKESNAIGCHIRDLREGKPVNDGATQEEVEAVQKYMELKFDMQTYVEREHYFRGLVSSCKI